MNGVDLLPAALVAAFAVGAKFSVDLAARVYEAQLGRELPAWGKQVVSFLVAAGMTLQARVDVFAALRGEPTASGYVLTALVLAGLASEVAHPALEAAKELGRKLQEGRGMDGAVGE